MKNLYIIGILLIGFAYCGHSQSMKQYIEAAEEKFDTKDYYSALSYYSEALEFDDSRTDILYKAAESARLFDAYSEAEEKYQMVIDRDTNMEYPLANYWLAEMKQRKGNYTGAIESFKFYTAEPGDNDDAYYMAKAKKEIKACQWALEQIENPDESVEVKHLNGVNTEYSDFGPFLKDEQLYYSSLAYTMKNDVHEPQRLGSKILRANRSERGEIVESLNRENGHTAHTAFSGDGSRMYYTECHYINSSEIRCNINYREVQADGEFGVAVNLPDFINSTEFTSTQPNIGYDKEMDKEVLYFVSDRPGGKGGLDIWKSVIDANWNFSEPINISALNTVEDEISPFYHRGSDVLYFSSVGYQGMGGFDIYKSGFINGAFATAEHLAAPVNGSYHDAYYTLDESGLNGHFASNRLGAVYIDEEKEACCFDIYSATYEDIKITLNALTFDKHTQIDLEQCTVQLIDTDTGEIVGEFTNPTANDHLFELEREKNYTLIATRPGFTSDRIEFHTKNIYKSQEIVKKLYLGQDKISLDVFTFDKNTNLDLIGCTVQLMDLTTGRIVGESQYNGNANDFHWMLERNKSYKVTATKAGYTMAQTTFNTEGEIPNNKIVKKLYLGRAFLPIVLYFDNDIPDLRSVKTYTNKSYSETYNKYIVRKEEFKSRYGRNLSGNERTSADQRLEDFFEADVRGGYDRLNQFMPFLTSELRAGKRITINVKGFASPRAASKYNLALGERRIHSLKNELVRYQGGILSDYITNGALTIENVSFGEETAPSGISDVLNDVKNSVFSVEASRERRIELVNLKYN